MEGNTISVLDDDYSAIPLPLPRERPSQVEIDLFGGGDVRVATTPVDEVLTVLPNVKRAQVKNKLNDDGGSRYIVKCVFKGVAKTIELVNPTMVCLWDQMWRVHDFATSTTRDSLPKDHQCHFSVFGHHCVTMQQPSITDDDDKELRAAFEDDRKLFLNSQPLLLSLVETRVKCEPIKTLDSRGATASDIGDDNAGLDSDGGSGRSNQDDEKDDVTPVQVCGVCWNGTSEDDNPIFCCGRCGVVVHQMCYGVGEVPEGDWFCEMCAACATTADGGSGSNASAAGCALCHKKGGVLKATACGHWAHMDCVLYIPELSFDSRSSSGNR
jgi:hypothetical protein